MDPSSNSHPHDHIRHSVPPSIHPIICKLGTLNVLFATLTSTKLIHSAGKYPISHHPSGEIFGPRLRNGRLGEDSACLILGHMVFSRKVDLNLGFSDVVLDLMRRA
ncbi:hypothetical protein DL95DRAFT_390719 [Leptodontidium sp. 2 PMI_412]|nr:hypothetical protein DL95DRAFT_390719 [Leptodontidium sp. 2 PMI_412]